MQKQIAVILFAAFALTGCAPQPDAAKQQQAVTADGQTVVAEQTPGGPKKKCANQVGSRLAPCGEGSTGDYVAGSTGQAWREATDAQFRPLPSPH